jgi:hypothetical protein
MVTMRNPSGTEIGSAGCCGISHGPHNRLAVLNTVT